MTSSEIEKNAKSGKNIDGRKKRILELDIEKCFDRINHKAILDNLISPQCVKQGIQRCLVAGVNPEFPEQGTPQGGVGALRSAQW
jgi:retron-type reverse transcriptase